MKKGKIVMEAEQINTEQIESATTNELFYIFDGDPQSPVIEVISPKNITVKIRGRNCFIPQNTPVKFSKSAITPLTNYMPLGIKVSKKIIK